MLISSILLFITIPSLKNFYSRTNEKIISEQLLQAIEYAKQEAQLRYQAIGICKSKNHISCSGNWEDGQIIFIDRNQNGSIANGKDILSVIYTSTTSDKLHWREFPKYRDYLQFLPQHFMQSDNGTFWFCADAKPKPTWAIMLNKSGNAHLVYPDKNGVIKDSQDKLLSCEDTKE